MRSDLHQIKEKNIHGGDENGLSPGFRNSFGHERSKPVFGNAVLDENYLLFFLFLLFELVGVRLGSNLPKIGIHRLQFRCYDARAVTLPDHTQFSSQYSAWANPANYARITTDTLL